MHCKIPVLLFYSRWGSGFKSGYATCGYVCWGILRECPAVYSRSKALAKGLEKTEHQMLKHFCKCKIYVSRLVENKCKIYVAHFQKRVWPASAVLLF